MHVFRSFLTNGPLPFGLVILSSLCLAGCGGGPSADYEKLGLVDISGVVTLDGTAISGAVVMFEASDQTYCYGTTDASGKYTLKLNSDKTGVLPGDKVVRISTTASTGEEEGSAGEEVDPDASPAAGKKEEKVPACYNKDSKLNVTVTSSDSSFNFDLKSDCSTTGRS
jgi:hypothetical protein